MFKGLVAKRPGDDGINIVIFWCSIDRDRVVRRLGYVDVETVSCGYASTQPPDVGEKLYPVGMGKHSQCEVKVCRVGDDDPQGAGLDSAYGCQDGIKYVIAARY